RPLEPGLGDGGVLLAVVAGQLERHAPGPAVVAGLEVRGVGPFPGGDAVREPAGPPGGLRETLLLFRRKGLRGGDAGQQIIGLPPGPSIESLAGARARTTRRGNPPRRLAGPGLAAHLGQRGSQHNGSFSVLPRRSRRIIAPWPRPGYCGGGPAVSSG